MRSWKPCDGCLFQVTHNIFRTSNALEVFLLLFPYIYCNFCRCLPLSKMVSETVKRSIPYHPQPKWLATVCSYLSVKTDRSGILNLTSSTEKYNVLINRDNSVTSVGSLTCPSRLYISCICTAVFRFFFFLLHLQILLTSDVLFAFLRREYDLQHGIYPPVLDGDAASVILTWIWTQHTHTCIHYRTSRGMTCAGYNTVTC